MFYCLSLRSGIFVSLPLTFNFSLPQLCNALTGHSQGLDLARLTDKRQFAFVDGLSELFNAPVTTPSHSTSSPFPGAAPSRTVLPVRSQPGPIPVRGPQPVSRPPAPAPNSNATPTSKEIGPVKRLNLLGNGTMALNSLEREIAAVVKQLQMEAAGDGEESEVLLIIDQPDLLLAATGPSRGIGATEMGDWIMGLQQVRIAECMSSTIEWSSLTKLVAYAECPYDCSDRFRRLAANT